MKLSDRISILEDITFELAKELHDLKEAHRKQIGLLHKRVSKRKTEVDVVRTRVASTRGRVTKVEKSLQSR